MNFIPLKDLLPKAASKHNFTAPLLAAHVCEKYRKSILKIFGDDALAHSWPKWFRKMVLTVGVENSAWGQEIYFRKGKILENMNKEFGRQAVADIRTVVEVRDY